MRPVFVGGCDRSGTTMLGSLLGTHSECLCVPESQFIIEVLGACDLDGDRVDPLAVTDLITRHPRFRVWELDIGSHSPFAQQVVIPYAELIEWIVRQYGETRGMSSPHLWVDHTPSNTQHAATLFSLFPNARMVHIVRDGRAVASSLLSVSWGPSAIDRAAYYWLRTLAYGLAAESYYGPARLMRVRYEDLVAKPAATLGQVCAFLEIDYQPQMIRGDGFKIPTFTQRFHSLVGQEPDRTRVDAWKSELTPRQIEIFESVTGDMLVYLGYEPQFGARARGMTYSERLGLRLKTIGMYVGNMRQQAQLHRLVGSPGQRSK